MLLGPGVNAARQRANYSEVKHLQICDYNRAPVSDYEVKNIGSAGCAGFTQFTFGGVKTDKQTELHFIY